MEMDGSAAKDNNDDDMILNRNDDGMILDWSMQLLLQQVNYFLIARNLQGSIQRRDGTISFKLLGIIRYNCGDIKQCYAEVSCLN